MEPADEAPEPVEPWAPEPRSLLKNPLVVVFAVLLAIGIVSAGLVSANGDDFAVARIPVRQKLPLAGMGGGTRESAAAMDQDAPALYPGRTTREIQVPTPLVDPPRVANAYRLGDVSRRDVSRLGAVLGIEGDELVEDGQHIVRGPARQLSVAIGFGGTFSVGPPTMVSCGNAIAGSGWSGSPGATRGPAPDAPDDRTTVSITDGCVVASPGAAVRSDGGSGSAPVKPTPAPAPPPDGAVGGSGPDPATQPAAARVAVGVMRLLEISGSYTTTPAGDHWALRIPRTVDGLRAQGWEIDLGVSPQGEVLFGYGWLADAEKVDSYPLVGHEAALERLRTGWTGSKDLPAILPSEDPSTPAGPSLTPVDGGVGSTSPCIPGPATTCPAIGEVPPPEPSACKPQPDGREICETPTPPYVVEPLPGPPPGPIVITGVRLGLQLASNGVSQFLVPAYVFSTKDDGELVVPAIRDEDVGGQLPYGFPGERFGSPGPRIAEPPRASPTPRPTP